MGNSENAQRERLERLAALPEETIDTSDIPEMLDWSGSVRGSLDAAGKTRARRHALDRLRSSPAPADQAAATALAAIMERDLSLANLRRARAMTQDQLAADLHIGQDSVAKLERRADMYLSTLRRFVEAMGGELEIVARFPDHPQVNLHGIGELAETEPPA